MCNILLTEAVSSDHNDCNYQKSLKVLSSEPVLKKDFKLWLLQTLVT